MDNPSKLLDSQGQCNYDRFEKYNTYITPPIYGSVFHGYRNESKAENHIKTSPELLSAWTELKLAKSKLQTSAKVSSLMAGFAMVAMIEIQYEANFTPVGLMVAFCIVTTILIFSHLISLGISSSILPTLDTISDTYVPELILHSPHRRLNFFIQLSWFISNMWGNFLMLILVTLVLWIKFANYKQLNNYTAPDQGYIGSILAPIVGTTIVLPILLILIMISFYIYATMHKHRMNTQKNELKNLEEQVESLRMTSHHLQSL